MNLRITYMSEEGDILKESTLRLPSENTLDNGNIVQMVLAYAESLLLPDTINQIDDQQEGQVVTPLPPDRIKSGKIEGIVTPKPPLEFAREQEQRHREVLPGGTN